MKTLSKKIPRILLPLFLLVLVTSNAFATGGRSDGGGDLCENRIKTVRDDLRSWIAQGGPQGLHLPSGISVQSYSDQMLTAISGANVQCVGAGDPGYPVQIAGVPKVCRFSQDTRQSVITCDIVKFSSLGESDQYVLVHHEYAGLAGLELPNGVDSHYEISNQISGYLVDQVVKKLAVKPQPAPSILTCKSIDTSTAPTGTKCLTSKGAVYERVSRLYFGAAWKGPDGLIWSERIKRLVNRDGAIATCKDLEGVLPSKADFERGEAAGFREVVVGMKKNGYWTYSPCSNEDNAHVCVFGANNGSFVPINTATGDDRIYKFPVLCVAQ